MPLYRDPKSGDVVTQFDMRCVEKIGLIKFDFLGLRTLTTIAAAAQRVREGGLPDFDIEKIPLRRREDLRDARRGRHRGRVPGRVGRHDRPHRQAEAARVQGADPDRRALPARARSARAWSTTTSTARTGSREVEYLLPELEELTAETLGVIVYQDQVLQIANRLAGYSLGEADLLRRAMGKKKPEEMAKQQRPLRATARSSAASTRRRPSRSSR